MSHKSNTGSVHAIQETPNQEPVLAVHNLQKHFPLTEGFLRREVGRVRAVDGISFNIQMGETLGIVGESGCGKSTIARTMLGLDAPTDGDIAIFGHDVDEIPDSKQAQLRRRVQMVFQDPKSSFDPQMTINKAISEPMMAHGLTDDEVRGKRIDNLLELVGLSIGKGEQYPHELSGGEKQRAALARALSVDPDLLVLDEPVSALDVSVQAEILSLIDELQHKLDLTVLLISHDMSVVQFLCGRVAVMYLGEFVESGQTDAVFDDPKHPYTQALLSAVPQPDPADRADFMGLPGDVPDPSSPPSGCRFHTRCPKVIPPSDIDVPQSTWRAILDFRIALQNYEFDLDAVRERVVAADSTIDGTSAIDEETLSTEIRSEYDIPQPVADGKAETALKDAITAAARGEIETATAQLMNSFPTVCANEIPKESPVADRKVACHLYE